MKPYLLGTILSVALAVTVGALRSPSTATQSAPVKAVIPQPQHWVPLEAEILVTTPGMPASYGHFYRASDGSTRTDSGPDRTEVRVMSINNIPTQMHYLKNSEGWTGYPLNLPKQGWKPDLFPMTSDMPGLTRFPQRAYIEDAQLIMAGDKPPGPDTYTFEAYRRVNSSGFSCVLVPELNFFPVLCQDLPTGKRIAYSNVRLGVEPPSSLFEPPVGAVVTLVPSPVAEHNFESGNPGAGGSNTPKQVP